MPAVNRDNDAGNAYNPWPRDRLKKPKTFRSEGYLEFIRTHPCLECGDPKTVAHHESLGQNMMGGKPPDTHAVPLCVACHDMRHHIGAENFWSRDVRMAIIQLLTEYLQNGNPDPTGI